MDDSYQCQVHINASVPDVYQALTSGIDTSLKNYLETGIGQPFEVEVSQEA